MTGDRTMPNVIHEGAAFKGYYIYHKLNLSLQWKFSITGIFKEGACFVQLCVLNTFETVRFYIFARLLTHAS
jgi:hypothetical protein